LVISAAVRLLESRIRVGLYEHIGIRWGRDYLEYEPQILPAPSVGRWSLTNAQGRIVKLRKLPKVEQTRSIETPNYGDWSRGSHDVTFTQLVYQTELIPPKHLGFTIELIGEEPGPDPAYTFKVSVDEVLNRGSQGFEDALFYNLNLLQENVGVADVFASSAFLADYLGTLFVSWEILPPGEREKNIAIILRGVHGLSDKQKKAIEQRYRVIEGLHPQDFVVGFSGFRRYFGARFSASLVVLENVQYGNAIYVMGADWEELSQLSRMELLRRAEADFTRIPHFGEWQSRLRAEIATRRQQH
jgi:hypothetical protein